MYVVYQDGKRCSEYSYAGYFSEDSFQTKEDAELYMILWAYPVGKEQAEVMRFSTTLGEEYDMSMGEFPVMMKIEFEEEPKCLNLF